MPVPVPASVPDPHVCGPAGSGSISQRYGSGSGSGSFYNKAKIVRKTLIPTVSWLLLDFLSLKNYVNVTSKSTVPNKQKNFFSKNWVLFCWNLEVQWRKYQDQDPNPDSLVRGIDPRILGSTPKSHGSGTPAGIVTINNILLIQSTFTDRLSLYATNPEIFLIRSSNWSGFEMHEV